jgi:hypothetical protein
VLSQAGWPGQGRPLSTDYAGHDGFKGLLIAIADALDSGAAGRELVLEPLEAAVEMVDAVDHGLALGGKRSDHQRHRGAQVGRHHGSALEAVDAFDGRGLPFEMNAGAEPRQLRRSG